MTLTESYATWAGNNVEQILDRNFISEQIELCWHVQSRLMDDWGNLANRWYARRREMVEAGYELAADLVCSEGVSDAATAWTAYAQRAKKCIEDDVQDAIDFRGFAIEDMSHA